MASRMMPRKSRDDGNGERGVPRVTTKVSPWGGSRDSSKSGGNDAAARGPEDRHPDRKGERVAKVIARAGLGSRREAEEWIGAGRVAINGTGITSPAVNVTPTDAVTI